MRNTRPCFERVRCRSTSDGLVVNGFVSMRNGRSCQPYVRRPSNELRAKCTRVRLLGGADSYFRFL